MKTIIQQQQQPQPLSQAADVEPEPLNEAEICQIEKRPYICLPYIPTISNALRRVAKKSGLNVVFKSGQKLRNIIGTRCAEKRDQRQQKGIYRFDCPCGQKYVGQTSRKIAVRGKEHGKVVERGNWSHSGISAHKQTCDHPIDWENPIVLDTMTAKNKLALQYNLRLRESLHIAKENCGPGYGLNEDWGGHLHTRVWHPLFQKIRD